MVPFTTVVAVMTPRAVRNGTPCHTATRSSVVVKSG